MPVTEEGFTVKEKLLELSADISAVNLKVDALDAKLDNLFDTAPGKILYDDLKTMKGIIQIHENRWQRIIGVLLVLTFLGVSSLVSILLLVGILTQAVLRIST
jgi:hypothetical protein